MSDEGDDAGQAIRRIEALPLEDRADAYRAEQRRLQDRLERPTRPTGA